LPEARAGLLLFVRRGMWGWARALAAMSISPEPTGCRSSTWQAREEYRTVIHIFAALAIKAGHEGATQ
jgi:hypothetical protein